MRAGRPLLHTTVGLGPGAPAWLPPVAPRAYASTVHIGDRRRPSVLTGEDAVRLPLPGGWVATAWGEELHRGAPAGRGHRGPRARAGARVSGLVVRARRVVLPDGERPAAVHVRGRPDHRDHRRSTTPVPTPVTLADDEVLLPGLVDSHVHVNEPGRTEWEGFASATRAAAAGGVTTIVDMPLNSIPPTVNVEALHVKREAATGQVASDVAFWGGAVPGNVEPAPAAARGRRGRLQVLPARLRRARVPAAGRRRAAGRADRAGRGRRPADRARRGRRRDRRGPGAGRPRYAGFLASRPRRGRGDGDRAADRRGPRTPAPGCTSCTSPTPTRLPMLRAARADGVRITVETCPHYLTFGAEEVPDGATSFKCCPPIREAAHREALWTALADGDIDLVVSDHSPCTAGAQAARRRRLRRGLGRHRLAAGGPARGVDRGARARARADRRRPVDGRRRRRGWPG